MTHRPPASGHHRHGSRGDRPLAVQRDRLTNRDEGSWSSGDWWPCPCGAWHHITEVACPDE